MTDNRTIAGLFLKYLDGDYPTAGVINDMLEDLDINRKLENNHHVYWVVVYYDSYADNDPLNNYHKESFFSSVELSSYILGLDKLNACFPEVNTDVIYGEIWEEFVNNLYGQGFINQIQRNMALSQGEDYQSSLHDVNDDLVDDAFLQILNNWKNNV